MVEAEAAEVGVREASARGSLAYFVAHGFIEVVTHGDTNAASRIRTTIFVDGDLANQVSASFLGDPARAELLARHVDALGLQVAKVRQAISRIERAMTAVAWGGAAAVTVSQIFRGHDPQWLLIVAFAAAASAVAIRKYALPKIAQLILSRVLSGRVVRLRAKPKADAR